MRNWSEIRQAILNKLFMEEDEVNSYNDKYAKKFAYFANECLSQIANALKPRVAVFDVKIYPKRLVGSNFKLEKPLIAYMEGYEEKEEEPNTHTAYVDDINEVIYVYNGLELIIVDEVPDGFNTVEGIGFELYPLRITYNDDKWVIPQHDVIYFDGLNRYIFKKGELIRSKHSYNQDDMVMMPNDFISFANMTNYKDNIPDPKFIYYGDRQIMFPEVGSYKIFYNALWQEINEEYMDARKPKDLPIDQSVLNCIPTYVASQILAEDDPQRSAVLRNEYELMLSRLDTTTMYEEGHFKSTGGWY